MEVKGSVVVITGGGTGIGAAVAKNLAEDKAKVVLAGRRIERLEQTVKEIKEAGGEAIAVQTDVTKEEDQSALMDKALETFGSLDVVLANAGRFNDSLMINTDKATGKVKNVMTTEQFKSVVDTNLIGTFLTLREAARRMADSGKEGLLLITSSINSTGQIGQLNYSSTKVALTLWPKILVGEFHLKHLPIRVVGVSPGYTATEILKGMNETALEVILKDVHVGHLVEPEELAGTIKHVISNDSIDGTTIEVTGGLVYGPRARAK
ncbi:MAG: SDR family NAD(P)-dependent oxidoreductase [Candidatus Thiosymbion ectosymbiont of Robbea hypermnestra]|nr:SDR family NAD(P)-dependent oxidoreductase [Candidatus Thiosymbion ectosymbiont of Robbea hypermnestra]